MHALVRFAHIAAGSTFMTAELYPYVLAALQISADQYSLASLRYDLSKLRAKALVDNSRDRGAIGSVHRGIRFVWCFSNSSNASTHARRRVTSALPGRLQLEHHNRTQLDRLYQKIVDDLNKLLGAIGLKAA
jgi:hypothetical protein